MHSLGIRWLHDTDAMKNILYLKKILLRYVQL